MRRTRTARTAVLALILAALAGALPAAGSKETKLLKAVLAAEPCSALWGLKPGDRFSYQLFPSDDFEARSFLVLKQGSRRILLELRLEKGAEPELVERRAWVLRRGRRLLTEADGYKACETRLAAPERRLEDALSRAEASEDWHSGRWPAAPKADPKKKPKAAGAKPAKPSGRADRP